ncbi:MAG: hypothetical protein JWN25_1042, partial [Verrucomicrobiales bacterium]|nr:hypothetical protein [Verrucomicrobiales bacterium]
FHQADQKTIEESRQASVQYTSSTASLSSRLNDVDVLYLSNNQPITDREARNTILHWPSNKGMLLVHPALWYNWNDWPEYNSQLVGGGARSHDAYGEFEVTIEKKDHPVTAGVPEHFRLKDELYHFEKAAGSDIEVLATGKNIKTGESYPLLWIVHAKDKNVGRIVCLTLGHDADSHENPAYKKILTNALLWAGHKN